MNFFRVLEHTADVGFEAWGATCEEVFSNSARALQDLSVDLAAIAPREEIPITVTGDGASELLVNWLSRLLYLFDAEGWVFCNFLTRIIEGCALQAVAKGERFDPARHPVKLQVKAITYHQLALERSPEGWRARVFVDI